MHIKTIQSYAKGAFMISTALGLWHISRHGVPKEVIKEINNLSRPFVVQAFSLLSQFNILAKKEGLKRMDQLKNIVSFIRAIPGMKSVEKILLWELSLFCKILRKGSIFLYNRISPVAKEYLSQKFTQIFHR